MKYTRILEFLVENGIILNEEQVNKLKKIGSRPKTGIKFKGVEVYCKDKDVSDEWIKNDLKIISKNWNYLVDKVVEFISGYIDDMLRNGDDRYKSRMGKYQDNPALLKKNLKLQSLSVRDAASHGWSCSFDINPYIDNAHVHTCDFDVEDNGTLYIGKGDQTFDG